MQVISAANWVLVFAVTLRVQVMFALFGIMNESLARSSFCRHVFVVTDLSLPIAFIASAARAACSGLILLVSTGGTPDMLVTMVCSHRPTLKSSAGAWATRTLLKPTTASDAMSARGATMNPPGIDQR